MERIANIIYNLTVTLEVLQNDNEVNHQVTINPKINAFNKHLNFQAFLSNLGNEKVEVTTGEGYTYYAYAYDLLVDMIQHELYEWIMYYETLNESLVFAPFFACCPGSHVNTRRDFLRTETSGTANTCFFRVYASIRYCSVCRTTLTNNESRTSVGHGSITTILLSMDSTNPNPSAFCFHQVVTTSEQCRDCGLSMRGSSTTYVRHSWSGTLIIRCIHCGASR